MVFRYLLASADKSVVPLASELDFLGRYLGLLRSRFGGALRVELRDRGVDPHDVLLPPCALQLLVENAVKHNVFHARAPLTVEVDLYRDRVVVKNERRPRQDAAAGPGVGLANLAERVRLTAGRALEIDAGDAHFTVSLPLEVAG